jgi:hypothetical protein
MNSPGILTFLSTLQVSLVAEPLAGQDECREPYPGAGSPQVYGAQVEMGGSSLAEAGRLRDYLPERA